MRSIDFDFVVEVPDGADPDAVMDRLLDAFIAAVEAEGAVMGGGARPATEEEVLARDDAQDAVGAATAAG